MLPPHVLAHVVRAVRKRRAHQNDDTRTACQDCTGSWRKARARAEACQRLFGEVLNRREVHRRLGLMAPEAYALPRSSRVQQDGAWQDSTWWRMLQQDGLFDEGSYQWKLFRRRFRMPPCVFRLVCSVLKPHMPDAYDITGRPAVYVTGSAAPKTTRTT